MTEDTELGLLLKEPFPDPEEVPAPISPVRRRRIPRGRVGTALVLAIVLTATGVGVWAATGSSAATYRVAPVARGAVNQTLNSYGTITPVNQAAVSFPSSGTVATVPVAIGQQVSAGQTLATLETSSLQSRLDAARSTLTTAQAKLVTDSAAEASGTTATTTSATLAPADASAAVPLSGPSSTIRLVSARPAGSHAGGDTIAEAQSAVAAAQKALLADQRNVDALTAVVAADVRSGTATCTSLIATLKGLIPAGGAPSPTPSPSTPPATSPAGSAPDPTICTNLLSKILTDQQAVTTTQSAVSNDETALTAAVSKLTTAAQSATTAGSSSSTSPSTSPGNSGTSGTFGSQSTSGAGGTSGSSGSGSSRGGGSSGVVTAAQLVVDQATVDADAAAVTVAQQALTQATLVSPLAGTVAALAVTPGSTASTSTAAVTVIGPGTDEVSTTVSDLNLNKVRVGALATVTPDGSDVPVSGKVTAIGLLPVSSTTSSTGTGRSTAASSTSSSSTTSTSSATYPVTISLDKGGLYSGSGADVAIVVKTVTNVLTVPTSAVTTDGTRALVTVRQGHKAVRKLVVTGASDPILTEVTSGLEAGELVTLAQLNLPVPASGSSSLTSRALGGSRTGGAGFGGAGGFTRAGGGTTRGG